MFYYKHTKRPEFLEDAFHWKKMGYSYKCPPEIILRSEEALHSKDPWLMFASVVEYAKFGERKDLKHLMKLVMIEDTDPTLVGGVLDFIADSGGKTELEILAELMLDAPKYLKIRACQAAKWAGEIWLIPMMLEAWSSIARRADREAIEVVISNLLDPFEGQEIEFFDVDCQEEEYRHNVIERIETLTGLYGSDRVSIIGGEAIDIHQLVWRMRNMLSNQQNGWRDWGEFLILRHKFEVYTGIDCSHFYDDGRFQALNTSTIIEEFLNYYSGPEFKRGSRYFFLNPIRD